MAIASATKAERWRCAFERVGQSVNMCVVCDTKRGKKKSLPGGGQVFREQISHVRWVG